MKYLKPAPADDKFNRTQLRRGQKVEMEHTRIPSIAERIAKHHLMESPSYYRELDKMERKLDRMKKKKK